MANTAVCKTDITGSIPVWESNKNKKKLNEVNKRYT